MITLGFIEGNTWIIMIISGVIGLLYSGERVYNALPFLKADLNDKSTNYLKKLSLIMGILASIWVSLLIIDDAAQFRWLTLFLLILFILVSLAHPIKDLEGWHTIVITIPFIIIGILTIYLRNSDNLTVLGNPVSLTAVVGLGLILIFGLFILVFFVEDIVVDPLLWLIGWAPLKLVVCILVILQGVFLFLNPVNGLLTLIGDV